MKHFFETTAGVKIEIAPISLVDLQLVQSAVEKEFRDNGEPLDPPTYKVETLGGDFETHEYTELTIAEDNVPESDKVIWAAHKAAKEKLQQEIATRTAYVFLDGVKVELPESDEWAKRRKKLFNEDIPENEDDKKLYYLNNVLLKTPADKNGIFLEIQKLSMTGVSEEVISAMESVFRRAVENSGRAIVEQLKNTESEGGEALVLQPTTEE